MRLRRKDKVEIKAKFIGKVQFESGQVLRFSWVHDNTEGTRMLLDVDGKQIEVPVDMWADISTTAVRQLVELKEELEGEGGYKAPSRNDRDVMFG